MRKPRLSPTLSNNLCHPNRYVFITSQLGEEVQISLNCKRATCRNSTCTQHLHMSCLGGVAPAVVNRVKSH